jgi:hypothetical protein
MNFYDDTMKVLETFDVGGLLCSYAYLEGSADNFENICLDCLELLEELEIPAPNLDAIQDFVAMIF